MSSAGTLQDGDVVLLEARDDDPISRTVEVIDVCPYSHGGFVHVHPHGVPYLVSTTLTTTPRGVTSLDLADINKTRELAVLRIDGGTDALGEAVRWVDPPSDDPNRSDFGTEQIVLASAAATARHLQHGFDRRVLSGFAHVASKLLLPSKPCGYTKRPPVPDDRIVDRWDCAAFLDHAFCVTGNALDIEEGDPLEKNPEAVLEAYCDLARGLLAKLCKTKPPTPVPDAELSDDDVVEALGTEPTAESVRSLRDAINLVIRLMFCAIPVPVPDVLAYGDDPTDTDTRIWPPFMSLRRMMEEHPPDFVIPRGGLGQP